MIFKVRCALVSRQLVYISKPFRLCQALFNFFFAIRASGLFKSSSSAATVRYFTRREWLCQQQNETFSYFFKGRHTCFLEDIAQIAEEAGRGGPLKPYVEVVEKSSQVPRSGTWSNFSLAPSVNGAFSSGKRDDCRGSSASQGPICVFSDLGVLCFRGPPLPGVLSISRQLPYACMFTSKV